MKRHSVIVVAMTIAGALTVIGTLLPWVRVGTRRRNSYDVFELAGRLGLAPDGPVANGLRWWAFVPLLTAIAVVAVWWGWLRPGAAVGVVAGVYAGGVGAVVARTSTRGITLEAGPAVTAAGGLALLAGSVVVWWRAPGIRAGHPAAHPPGHGAGTHSPR